MMFKTVIERCNNRIVRTAFGGFLVATLMLVGPFSVLASEIGSDVDEADVIHNEEQLDPDTGLPVSDDAIPSGDNHYTDTISYNKETDRFEYAFDETGSSKVSMSVADGMITNDKVSIELTADLQYELMYEGKDITNSQSLSGIEKAGTYALFVGFGSSTERVRFTFGIVHTYTKVAAYSAPDGFYFSSAMFNDEALEISQSAIDTSAEGKYVITSICHYSGKAYVLNMTVDHTPPTITLVGVDENNRAKGVVEIQNIENDAKVYIERDGAAITFSDKLTEYGKYHIVVTDLAGNSSTYDFTIQVYFTGMGIVFFIIMGVVILAVIAFLVIAKRRFRVR